MYYRLHVFPIRIPPLRDRKEDIPQLVSYFVQKFARQMQKKIEVISPAVMKGLTAWEWPGNIRELENFIERAVIITRGKSLEALAGEPNCKPTSLPMRTYLGSGRYLTNCKRDYQRPQREQLSLEQRSETARRTSGAYSTETRGRVGGADGAAARMGVNRTTLYARLRKFHIDPQQYS